LASNFFNFNNFYSFKFYPAEINYKIHDKELLTIVDAFKEWHHLLEGVQHETIVYAYHKKLQYFMTIHVLI
jgi:hypothetical protein